MQTGWNVLGAVPSGGAGSGRRTSSRRIILATGPIPKADETTGVVVSSCGSYLASCLSISDSKKRGGTTPWTGDTPNPPLHHPGEIGDAV